MRSVCLGALGLAWLGLAWLQLAGAATILPPRYCGGINLITNGATVSRALTCWKNLIYVSVDAQDCHAGAALSSATVYAVDARDPSRLRYVSKGSEGGCKANGLVAFEDKLYVANWSALLRTFDIVDSSVIRQLTEYYVPGDFGWSLRVQRDRVYLAEAHELAQSFYIIDTVNPANPRLISATDWAGGPAVRGSYSFHREGTWFKVLNISDETAPTPAVAVDLGVNLGEPELRDRWAYIPWTIGEYTNGTSGIVCVDISDPLAPREVGRWTTPGFHFFGGVTLLGDLAFVPTSGNGVFAVNIASLTNFFTVAQFEVPYYALELAVAANGRYVFAGTVEGDRDAGVHAWQVFTQDPDDVGPGDWRNFLPRATSWRWQYDGSVLPSSPNAGWSLFEGSETWASVSNGTLRLNDRGTASGDKIKWTRTWDATSSRGATVMVRARCASYNSGGAFISNLVLEDGKHVEEFSILSNKFSARYANLEYLLDGTQWHTYRLTTRSNQFRLYLDEAPTPVLSGPLSVASPRARLILGSGSSPARQDIYFDYVQAFTPGAESPGIVTSDRTPDVSVEVSDLPGKGSTSLLATNTARVHWSTDGGSTWNSSGGVLWNGQFEGDVLPSSGVPGWHAVEGSEVYASVVDGALRIHDSSTASNTKLKYERHWRATPAVGGTLIARVRCAAAGGDTTYSANLFIEDGAHVESFKVLPDRLVARNAGLTHYLNGTVFHVYRITTKGDQFQVFVDESPTPVLSGTLTSATTANRVMFGSGASAGTQDVYFDYVRYSTAGDFPPGEGNGGGLVPVQVTLPPGASNGVDRCTLRVVGLPFNQYSELLNQVRFSIADLEGNVGWSPMYTVRTRMTDTDGDAMDDAWEWAYFGNLTRDGHGDFDGDDQSDYDEFVAATHPRDRANCFQILGVARPQPQQLTVTWSSVPGKAYRLEAAGRLNQPTWNEVSGGSRIATGPVTTWTGPVGPTAAYVRVVVLRP